jgi:hypothetical protein
MTKEELFFGKRLSEVILDVVKNTKDASIKVFCEEYHIARERMTSNFFTLSSGTLFRIMMGIAQLVSLQEFLTMCIRIAIITYYVANNDDIAKAIKNAHAGSPIGKKREKESDNNSTSKKNDFMKTKKYRIFNDMTEVSFMLRQFLNNCSGHDYNCLSIEQIVADERRINELTLAFAQTLSMISQNMDRKDWEEFWADMGEYIFEDEPYTGAETE